jgi:anti-sigma factor RsiW
MTVPPHDRCRELLEQLSRYVDGDVTGRERRAVMTHLKTCPCCQSMANGLQQTVEACRKAGSARLPADVRARARARIATLLASGPVSRST